jgi:hypothetical protein
MMGAKKWAYFITAGLAALWFISSAWVSIRMRYPTLGFYTLILLAFFLLELLWLKIELQRSFFDPQLTWYQGLPKPIPGLKCELLLGEKPIDMRVSRIDTEGAFIFSLGRVTEIPGVLSVLVDRKKLEMSFVFRDRKITCQGSPTLALDRGVGGGIQFFGVSSDLKKEIGDFIEVLQGEGYV